MIEVACQQEEDVAYLLGYQAPPKYASNPGCNKQPCSRLANCEQLLQGSRPPLD